MYILRYKDTTREPKVSLARRIVGFLRNLTH